MGKGEGGMPIGDPEPLDYVKIKGDLRSGDDARCERALVNIQNAVVEEVIDAVRRKYRASWLPDADLGEPWNDALLALYGMAQRDTIQDDGDLVLLLKVLACRKASDYVRRRKRQVFIDYNADVNHAMCERDKLEREQSERLEAIQAVMNNCLKDLSCEVCVLYSELTFIMRRNPTYAQLTTLFNSITGRKLSEKKIATIIDGAFPPLKSSLKREGLWS